MSKCIACSAAMVPRFRGKALNHLRCPQCGMECLSPQPDDSTRIGIYNETHFSHYQRAIDSRIDRTMKRATYERQIRRLPAKFLRRTTTTTRLRGRDRLFGYGARIGCLCHRDFRIRFPGL